MRKHHAVHAGEILGISMILIAARARIIELQAKNSEMVILVEIDAEVESASMAGLACWAFDGACMAQC